MKFDITATKVQLFPQTWCDYGVKYGKKRARMHCFGLWPCSSARDYGIPCCLNDRISPVHHHLRADGEASEVAAQPEHGGGDFFRFAEPPHGDGIDDGLHVLGASLMQSSA